MRASIAAFTASLTPARRRLLVHLGWPSLVAVLTVAVIHFLRYRMGLEVYWTWEPQRAAALALLAAAPLVVYELLTRNRDVPR